MDVYEDRKGYSNEPLGEFAWKLLSLIKAKKEKLIISDLLIIELKMNYSMEKINGMIKIFEDVIEKIIVTAKQRDEAKRIAKERNLPPGDVLHAILARDYKLIFVTRDAHFKRLEDISKSYKPEGII